MSPDDIQRELEVYEAKFGMSTEEFLRRWDRGEAGDRKEVTLWRGLVHMRDASKRHPSS